MPCKIFSRLVSDWKHLNESIELLFFNQSESKPSRHGVLPFFFPHLVDIPSQRPLYLPYSCEQTHVLLFRKSTFRELYKPDMLLNKTC